MGSVASVTHFASLVESVGNTPIVQPLVGHAGPPRSS